MFLTAEATVVIDRSPGAIWDYAADPQHWTASNPAEHFGLHYASPDNRPGPGVEFHQDEAVAGVRADLAGKIVHMERPRLLVWAGTATYRAFRGCFRARIPEGGVLSLEVTPTGTRFSHVVYMHFPDSIWGRFLLALFLRVLDGRAAVQAHTARELEHFKRTLEAGTEVVGRPGSHRDHTGRIL